jgi:hypothetical protein
MTKDEVHRYLAIEAFERYVTSEEFPKVPPKAKFPSRMI